MDDLARAFRAQSTALGLGVRGAKYPTHLRRLALRCWRRRREEHTKVEVAGDLGIPVRTLRRWIDGERIATHRIDDQPTTSTPTIHEVTIRPDDDAAPSTTPPVPPALPGPLTVTTATGLSIQGLTLDDVLTLVRALG